VRLVLQRVTEAEVRIGPESVGTIGRGLVALVGIEPGDGDEDIDWLVGKMTSLKIFDDAEGKMDCSLVDIQGDVLLVSQFTLFASTRKGTRPSWHRAARPEIAQPLYAMLHRRLEERLGKPVPAGVFGADMKVRLVNDGPVTLIIDSKSRE
jgi:D-tyrosyl-tRNA(Tyr) deacylase